jgi:alkylation response protein AidB-like acyl-CoA dehydrogenase
MSSALADDPDYWYLAWLDARPESIYGGSAQIQRNILSERHLGMPRM